MIDINTIDQLLKIFESLPKKKYEPTYLEICQYSGMRFEEICSRILAFYFQPKNEHGLDTLFLEAFFETIGFNHDNIDRNVKINLEEYVEGKRIDILLFNKDWVIGIENKTGSGVYNPLDIYKKRIDDFGKENNLKILLTLFEVNTEDELKIKENGFKKILYKDFFNKIKNKIGSYVSGSNFKYLILLYDFIETLEKKEGNIIMDKELDGFFMENYDRLNELLEKFNEFNIDIRQKTKNKLSLIMERICKNSNDKWSIWHEYVLLFENENLKIESMFRKVNNDIFSEFVIQIRFKTIFAWNQFGSHLQGIYPNAKHDHENGKNNVLKLFPNIDGDNEDEIVKRLKECYESIVNLK